MRNLGATLTALLIAFISSSAQQVLTPEKLWQLGRVSGLGLSADGKEALFKVTRYNLESNTSSVTNYSIPVSGGESKILTSTSVLKDKKLSPDGKHKISIEEVKVKKVTGTDFYPDLPKSNVLIYETLNYRHWDTWEDGRYSHLFVHPVSEGTVGEGKDIMKGEPFDTPQKPFGDEEDFTWSPDGKKIVYVAKKKFGTDYALSTNTDLYEYDISTNATVNLTEGMMGYDRSPAFSTSGALAWLSMKREGYESDKNDIVVQQGPVMINLTQQWDGTVDHFHWSDDGKQIWFTAPTQGTIQLFVVDYPGRTKKMPVVRQITKGDFDITGILGQSGNVLIVTRTDMNHAAELYRVNLGDGTMSQLSHVNDEQYSRLKLSKIERRMVSTTDGKQMLVWLIFPPDFDPSKKYPSLLYCQGGPQSALSQFYSFRWNFQLMAANGYIVIAPNRRGMPGFGVEWNEQISTDFGGQAMRDYLSAADAMRQEPFIDPGRMGCVGASYGGYSAFYLAGIHQNRFKSFISHDGIFNLKSMYGTTEEMWFVNWDLGGPYWKSDDNTVTKSYSQFDPSLLVTQWTAPILIIQGGKDYRVPIGQSLEAFQAAQLQGIKSKLVYLPEENHWVLTPQNGLVWQHEFFKWLKETL